MSEAQLHHKDYHEVEYRDSGTGVYLQWRECDPYVIRILSADRERMLGFFAALGYADATLENADAAIRRHINTEGKPYGEWAGLWQAG